MHKLKLITVILFGVFASAGVVFASGGGHALKHVNWPFDGVFGSVDRASAQRGFQVYKEVCSACHSMRLLSYRNLSEIGFSEAEIKVIAADYMVEDGPDDAGDMFERPARPSDRFYQPFPNANAARASNNGAFPADLSLLVKARTNGADYLYSLLTGYESEDEIPADVKMGVGMHYNPYFPGKQIAMPPPMYGGEVEYMDGTVATVDQMSRDMVNFLQWAAEPEMEQRKAMGVKVILFMLVFTVFFYLAKKRIWARLKK